MVEPLRSYEGSTLELIRRRQIRVPAASIFAGFLILAGVTALPLVKIDLLTTAGGMIRTGTPPVRIVAPVSGMVSQNLMKDRMFVSAGDTLVTFLDRLARTCQENEGTRYSRNLRFVSDIERILNGEAPEASSVYRQSHSNHLSELHELEIQRSYLQDEYEAAKTLYMQEVIPRSEFERHRTSYQGVLARIRRAKEQYRWRLEEEMSTLQIQNLSILRELEKANAALENLCITAPVDGVLQGCSGMATRSVVSAGSVLGMVVPSGHLVAECLVDPQEIGLVTMGMEVVVRMNSRFLGSGKGFRTRITGIDADAVVIGGRPVYRVSCLLDRRMMAEAGELYGPLLPGMTFTASLLLGRASLASLATGRLTRWLDPRMAGTAREISPDAQ